MHAVSGPSLSRSVFLFVLPWSRRSAVFSFSSRPPVFGCEVLVLSRARAVAFGPFLARSLIRSLSFFVTSLVPARPPRPAPKAQARRRILFSRRLRSRCYPHDGSLKPSRRLRGSLLTYAKCQLSRPPRAISVQNHAIPGGSSFAPSLSLALLGEGADAASSTRKTPQTAHPHGADNNPSPSQTNDNHEGSFAKPRTTALNQRTIRSPGTILPSLGRSVTPLRRSF